MRWLSSMTCSVSRSRTRTPECLRYNSVAPRYSVSSHKPGDFLTTLRTLRPEWSYRYLGRTTTTPALHGAHVTSRILCVTCSAAMPANAIADFTAQISPNLGSRGPDKGARTKLNNGELSIESPTGA